MMLSRVNNSYKDLLESMEAVPSEETNELVDQFKTNHPMLFTARCRSRITNLKRLLHELDKHLLIHPLKVTYLEEIEKDLQNTRISTLYRTQCNAIEQYNIEQYNIEQYNIEQQSQENGNSHSRVPLISGLAGEVKRKIVENIGQKWMELGRQLGVPEGKLDFIEETCRNDPYKRVYKVLDYFETSVPVADHKKKLLQGLQKSKRTDLAEQVQNLLLSN